MSELIKNEVKTPYRLTVNNGTVFREEDGANVKRTGYSKKLAGIVSGRLRNNPERDIELSAISEKAVSNMVKTLVYVQSNLSAFGKRMVVKNVSFKPIKVGEEEREVIAKVILLGIEDN